MTTETNNDCCLKRCIHPKLIAAAKNISLSDTVNHSIALLFKTLGDAYRLKVLQALEHDEMCICDIAAFLELSKSAISHKLRILQQLKLVRNRRNGPILYYRLSDHYVTQLLQIALEHSRVQQ